MVALTVASQPTTSTSIVRHLELLEARQEDLDHLLESKADPGFDSSKDCSTVAISLG